MSDGWEEWLGVSLLVSKVQFFKIEDDGVHGSPLPFLLPPHLQLDAELPAPTGPDRVAAVVHLSSGGPSVAATDKRATKSSLGGGDGGLPAPAVSGPAPGWPLPTLRPSLRLPVSTDSLCHYFSQPLREHCCSGVFLDTVVQLPHQVHAHWGPAQGGD